MKIAYLVYNERPDSGLMNTQVLGLLKELSKNSDLSITLIAIWQPWVYIKYLKEIKRLKVDLQSHNIQLKSLPFGFPGRYFFTNKYLLNTNIFYIYLILKVFNLGKYDIIHCRGYFISYIASLLKKDNKLIFDMRSLFPEENISAGNWTKEDLIYDKWKNIEKYTIEKSENIIGVSEPMVDILSKEYKTNKMKYIPIGFNSKNFIFDIEQRGKLRDELNIQNKIVIVYAGSLEFGFWNDIRVYVKYFSFINSVIDNAYFLILTGSDHQTIKNLLHENNINNYLLKSVLPNEVPRWLEIADSGIQVMDKMSDSETRFGVKTVEYLAMGLPVITNDNVGGIVKFINTEKLGITFNGKEDLDNLKTFLNNCHTYRDKSSIYAKEKFDMKKISDEYMKLYKSLNK